MQLAAATGCSFVLADERTADSGEKVQKVIEVNDVPRVIGKTVGVSAFSQDGKLLVLQHMESPPVGRATYDFLLVNAETGRAIKRLFTEDTPRVKAECVSISPDNRYVVAGSGDATIKVWDIEQGKQVDTIPGFGRLNIQFGHTGKYLAIGNDQHVELWDWQKRERIAQFKPEFSLIRSLRFSANDRWLAASGSSAPVVVFDVEQKIVAHSIGAAADRRRTCAISPDGTRLLTVGQGSNVEIWNLPRGERALQILGHRFASYDAAFRLDGQMVALLTGEYQLRLFDAETGRHVSTVIDPRKPRNPFQGPHLRTVRFLPRNTIAATNVAGEVLVWDLPQTLWWEKSPAK
jgi:WD40 repeat protein